MIRSKLFLKRKIGAQYVIVPVGKATLTFSGMISISESGSFIWDCLEKECTLQEIVAALTAEYEVDEATALADAASFTEKLKEVGAIE